MRLAGSNWALFKTSTFWYDNNYLKNQSGRARPYAAQVFVWISTSDGKTEGGVNRAPCGVELHWVFDVRTNKSSTAVKLPNADFCFCLVLYNNKQKLPPKNFVCPTITPAKQMGMRQIEGIPYDETRRGRMWRI